MSVLGPLTDRCKEGRTSLYVQFDRFLFMTPCSEWFFNFYFWYDKTDEEHFPDTIPSCITICPGQSWKAWGVFQDAEGTRQGTMQSDILDFPAWLLCTQDLTSQTSLTVHFHKASWQHKGLPGNWHCKFHTLSCTSDPLKPPPSHRYACCALSARLVCCFFTLARYINVSI